MTEHPDRVEMIRRRITEALRPLHFEVIDESHKHAGHAGNVGGGGHYIAKIVSSAFAGKSLLERHRMVYSALGNAMGSEIHAFSMKTLTPDEFDLEDELDID